MSRISFPKNKKGFSLIESIIAIAIFALLSGVIYQTSALLTKGIGAYRESIAVSSLASQYMEIIHNLPYSSIGTVSGNPHGTLPDELSNATTTINGSIYQIYYVVNYIDNPADGTALAGTDFASNDYKQIKFYVKNLNTEKIYNFLTNIAPKGLENLDSGGALVISILDSVGQAVPNANVEISNTILSPNINLSRMTDSSGRWIEVGLPNSVEGYHIATTKTGYSSDQTYPITINNPDPIKPDSTVVNGQITEISLSIDQSSDLSFQTLNQSCEPLANIDLSVQGEKLIGRPAVLKFDNNYSSNSSGIVALNNIEWDNYFSDLVEDTYMIYGSSPIQPITVSPNTEQNISLILGPKTDHALLTIVRDSATGNPIEGATVTLENTSPNFDQTKVTGGSIWSSNSWSGGSGQTNFVVTNKYFADDGQISTDIVPEALRLLSYDQGVTYASNGALISSIFDTATASTSYATLSWQPTSQDPETSIKFQIATADENTATTTWNFIGPDSTTESFYTSSGTAINNPSARYIRYKVYLHTDNPNKTPALTGVNINYISGCFTPGQVFFPSLVSDLGYQLTISADGYVSQNISSLEISGYTTEEILLNKI
ncbi:MAG: prepilin-type N-terminal cleavage/methylation domain-containing protein [Candidatus Paceibacterota bacterium]